MTSTNINIGIEGRSSSRILKPPGGGHSDIFGKTEGKVETTTSRYSKQAQKSSISQCFEYNSSAPIATRKPELEKEIINKPTKLEIDEPITLEISEPMKQEINESIKLEISENGLKNGTSSGTENKPASNLAPANQRVRVPPGGFSSGLW